MRDLHSKFAAAGATIAVITAHDLDEVQEHWQENALPYIGIADPDEVISTPYGQQWKLFKLGRMPAQFVVDCAGRLAFVHYGDGMSDIPDNREMLELLSALSACAGGRGG